MNLVIKIILFAVGLGAIIMITLAVYQETYRRYQIQKEIEDLQTQADKKERENERLKGLIEYFKTDDFQEKEAKEKLSLQKEGEKVLLVKDPNDPANTNSSSAQASQEQTPQKDTRTNARKWWDYFFAAG